MKLLVGPKKQNKHNCVWMRFQLVDQQAPGYDLYAPGELSRMKTDARSGQMADKSFV